VTLEAVVYIERRF